MLGEEHDPEAGVLGPDLVGRLDPLHAVRRRHPDVEHHHLGEGLQDALVQLGGIGGQADHLDARHGGQDAASPLAHEIVVVDHDDAEGGYLHGGGLPRVLQRCCMTAHCSPKAEVLARQWC